MPLYITPANRTSKDFIREINQLVMATEADVGRQKMMTDCKGQQLTRGKKIRINAKNTHFLQRSKKILVIDRVYVNCCVILL
jgi:hypothetical protein